MNGPFTSVAIGLPLDRQVEIGRFVFAATGGAYRFTMEPARGGFEVVAEWCEPGESAPCAGGYEFWGGSRWFGTPHEAWEAMYEWIARAAREERRNLEMDLEYRAVKRKDDRI